MCVYDIIFTCHGKFNLSCTCLKSMPNLAVIVPQSHNGHLRSLFIVVVVVIVAFIVVVIVVVADAVLSVLGVDTVVVIVAVIVVAAIVVVVVVVARHFWPSSSTPKPFHLKNLFLASSVHEQI